MDRFALDKLKNVMDDAKSAVKAKMGTDVERKMEEALSTRTGARPARCSTRSRSSPTTMRPMGSSCARSGRRWTPKGRQWRAVYKALSLLEHLIKNGTERVIENARDHMFKLRHLSGFSYHDGSVDRGNGVRDKAKQLVDMLNDNDMIRTEREKAGRLRNKYMTEATNPSPKRKRVEATNGVIEAKGSCEEERGTFEPEPKPATKAPSAEPSLLDSDFFGAAPAAAPSGNTFDPFAAAPAAAPQTASFAAFGNAAPAPQQSFDAFGAPPQQQQASFNAFGNTSAPAQGNQQFAAFPAAPAPQGFNAFGQQGNTASPPAPAFNQQQQFGQFGGMQGGMQQPMQGGMNMQQSHTASNSGGSQMRTNSGPQPEQKKSNDAWGAGSSLFDLNNLATSTGSNASNAGRPGHQQQQSNAGRNSFSGLDTLAGMPSKPAMGGAGGMNPMGAGMGGMNYGGGMPMNQGGMQQQPYGQMQMGAGGMGMGGMQPQPMMGAQPVATT
ncbi:ENTH domain [Phytophthora cactorum]|nr:ENTH domain [Phytophthora cactorum]